MKTCATLLMSLSLAFHTAPTPAQGAPPPLIDSGPTSGYGTTTESSSGGDAMRSEAGADLQAPTPSPISRLRPVTQDDVTYLCGGVGEEEAAYMKQQAKGYDLMLTFAALDGTYLADVDVDIADAKGNSVLQMACDSPILLVDLPRSGVYRVRAETAGYELNRTVRVSAKKRSGQGAATAVLSWPQHVGEPGAAATTSTGGSESGSSESGAR